MLSKKVFCHAIVVNHQVSFLVPQIILPVVINVLFSEGYFEETTASETDGFQEGIVGPRGVRVVGVGQLDHVDLSGCAVLHSSHSLGKHPRDIFACKLRHVTALL